ncbi:hypothetical protein CG402_00015 [Bifidobacteriaceae bacterium NR020]|nr:hypothetical protein CG402_00015 [Bifidobacteriaceae bacterium NR020]
MSQNKQNQTRTQLMLAQIARSLAKLALKAHCAFNLSEFPLRIAFARYALCAKAGRHAAQ